MVCAGETKSGPRCRDVTGAGSEASVAGKLSKDCLLRFLLVTLGKNEGAPLFWG